MRCPICGHEPLTFIWDTPAPAAAANPLPVAYWPEVTNAAAPVVVVIEKPTGAATEPFGSLVMERHVIRPWRPE
jgi:hypothetical protein